jgi:hypothetical protein
MVRVDRARLGCENPEVRNPWVVRRTPVCGERGCGWLGCENPQVRNPRVVRRTPHRVTYPRG